MWFNNDDKRTEKRIKGDDKERLAEDYLLAKGFSLIERNFLCKSGEIDLIMKDPNSKNDEYLVFVEVRYRESNEFGGALASITAGKQRKLRRAAEFYLLKNFGNTPPPCRFDVVGIEQQDQLEWIKNAF
jgi:putative endonuclease|tara:strand:- start:9632 stop:10018 length:387 start_codon:yes stop_codon:yes gene_type:complete